MRMSINHSSNNTTRSRRNDEHPEDEDENLNNEKASRNNDMPPTMMMKKKSSSPLQQQQHGAPPPPPPPPPPSTTTLPSLASKPHAFHGSVLSPDHAKILTCELALQLSSALSFQAAPAANAKGVIPGPDASGIMEEKYASSSSSQQQQRRRANHNIFQGSDVLDSILGWMAIDSNATTGASAGGPTSMIISTPCTPKPYNNNNNDVTNNAPFPPQVLQLLRQGSTTGSVSGMMAASASGGVVVGIPQTPKASSTPTSSSSPIYTPNPSIDGGGISTIHYPIAANSSNNNININPLSLLSTAEALDSFASYRTHYTVWITEAWNVLKWSEPTAALFWEMATMFHTLFVASLSVRGGGSGGEVRNRILFGGGDIPSSDASAGGGSGDGPFGAAVKSISITNNTTTNQRMGVGGGGGSSSFIPPLLSCGSQSSMGSVRSSVADPYSGSSTSDHRGSGSSSTGSSATKDISQGQYPSSPNPHHQASRNVGGSSGGGGMKPARHSARELPVWLISMFLLVHCEHEAVARCTSGGDDERRFSDHEVTGGGEMMIMDGSGGSSSLDFTALLHHKALSPRTRLHATGTHQNNANCASFLLRHLRKFLLLCAVPRNVHACRALAALAARVGGGGGEVVSDESHRIRESVNSTNYLDVSFIEEQHQREHGNIGLNVELTIEELDRLQLVLQAPCGGMVNEPPIAIGEHVLKCLALQELEMHRKSKPTTTANPGSNRWRMMQNGLVVVADAERIVRRCLEEELTAANKAELDGDSDVITSKLSKVSLCDGTATTSFSQSVSLVVSDSPDTVKGGASSDLKELSYQNLHSTTVLLESGRDTSPLGNNDGTSSSVASLDQHSQESSTTAQQVNAAATSAIQQQYPTSPPSNESGRLHDLHIANCSATYFYLLQPFEHATIAACTDCTIVVGAVAGLLNVVDCERTAITSAARRVVVSNSCDVVHYIFTPSPPLLVGDNRGCQFAPYNTYYEGLREDLLSTGLAAVLRSASGNDSLNGSVPGDAAASPGRGRELVGRSTITSALHTLQCASNKWKVPVELYKMEVPQVPNIQALGSASFDSSGGNLSPGADDRALIGGTTEVSMKTSVLLSSSDFDVLLIPVESDDARNRRQMLRDTQTDHRAEVPPTTTSKHEAEGEENEETPASGFDAGGETTTVHSNTSSLTAGDREKGPEERSLSPVESDYCRLFADLLTLSPFHMPHDYEKRVVGKAERVRSLQMAMQELNQEQRSNLEEELNKGFQDFLISSGNFRQVLDLILLESNSRLLF